MNVIKDVKDYPLLLFVLEPEKIMATLYENRKETLVIEFSPARPPKI
jgi:hypothetical protein